MNLIKKITALFCCCSAWLLAQNAAPIDSSLKQIETLYNSAQYVTAELEARRLYEEELITDSAKVQIEKWIAFSLIAQGKSSLARERFVSLLAIDPDFTLDPILTSPKILSVFYEAIAKFQLLKKNQPENLLETTQPYQLISYRTIVFPGWEQLYQGRTYSGAVFLGGGIATLGAGVAFELLRSNARSEYMKATVPGDISTKYNSYNNFRKAEMYSFAAFAIIYVASEIDVLTNFPSDNITLQTSSLNLGTTALLVSIHF